jgi:hypothetical protein
MDRGWELAPGVTVSAAAGTPEAAAMDAVFASFTAPPAGRRLATRPTARGLRLELDGVPLATVAPEALAPALEGAFVGWVVRARRDSAAFHAGCVSWGERAVLLVGDKGSGKSTLAAHLGASASYHGDEVALVRFADGDVTPFPKAATIKEGAFGCFAPGHTWRDPVRGPVRYVAPPGPATRHARLRPVALVFPRWTAGHVDASVDPVAPEAAALELVRQTFGGPGRHPRTLEVIAGLAALPAYELTYATLDAAASAVAALARAS